MGKRTIIIMAARRSTKRSSRRKPHRRTGRPQKKVPKAPQAPLELMKGKPRVEEEKFSVKFTGTQLNAVLLIILASTFLVQGIVRYLELVNKTEYLRTWFFIILMAMFFLSSSVMSITLGNNITILKMKRKMNLLSLATFILGFFLFLFSLVFLLFVI